MVPGRMPAQMVLVGPWSQAKHRTMTNIVMENMIKASDVFLASKYRANPFQDFVFSRSPRMASIFSMHPTGSRDLSRFRTTLSPLYKAVAPGAN